MTWPDSHNACFPARSSERSRSLPGWQFAVPPQFQHAPHTALQSLEIVPSRLLVDHVEQRLCTKPTGPRASHGLVRVRSVFLVNLDGLAPTARCCSIGEELRLAAFLQANEPKTNQNMSDMELVFSLPEDSLLYGVAHG